MISQVIRLHVHTCTVSTVSTSTLAQHVPPLHPHLHSMYRLYVSNDFKFITRSTISTKDKGEFEGKEYPLVKIEVSAESHPFYTGKHKIVDTAGRVDKFRKKFGSVGSKTSVAN